MVPSISMKHQQFNLRLIICLLTVKWIKSSSLPINRTLTDTTTSGKSEPGSNGYKNVLHIL